MMFLIDNQLPEALSRFLKSQNLNSVHVAEVGLDEASDQKIWQYAKSSGAVIISKDEDFFHLACSDPEGAALIWVRLGNCRKQELLTAFSQSLSQILTALGNRQKIIEIL